MASVLRLYGVHSDAKIRSADRPCHILTVRPAFIDVHASPAWQPDDSMRVRLSLPPHKTVLSSVPMTIPTFPEGSPPEFTQRFPLDVEYNIQYAEERNLRVSFTLERTRRKKTMGKAVMLLRDLESSGLDVDREISITNKDNKVVAIMQFRASLKRVESGKPFDRPTEFFYISPDGEVTSCQLSDDEDSEEAESDHEREGEDVVASAPKSVEAMMENLLFPPEKPSWSLPPTEQDRWRCVVHGGSMNLGKDAKEMEMLSRDLSAASIPQAWVQEARSYELLWKGEIPSANCTWIWIGEDDGNFSLFVSAAVAALGCGHFQCLPLFLQTTPLQQRLIRNCPAYGPIFANRADWKDALAGPLLESCKHDVSLYFSEAFYTSNQQMQTRLFLNTVEAGQLGNDSDANGLSYFIQYKDGAVKSSRSSKIRRVTICREPPVLKKGVLGWGKKSSSESVLKEFFYADAYLLTGKSSRLAKLASNREVHTAYTLKKLSLQHPAFMPFTVNIDGVPAHNGATFLTLSRAGEVEVKLQMPGPGNLMRPLGK
jgi:hypothetical protein